MESYLISFLISFLFALPISILWVYLITKQKEYNEEQKEKDNGE
jgi:hypothetical protein